MSFFNFGQSSASSAAFLANPVSSRPDVSAQPLHLSVNSASSFDNFHMANPYMPNFPLAPSFQQQQQPQLQNHLPVQKERVPNIPLKNNKLIPQMQSHLNPLVFQLHSLRHESTFPSIAKICKFIGFSILLDISSRVRGYSEQANRTKPNLNDVRMVFHEFGLEPIDLVSLIQEIGLESSKNQKPLKSIENTEIPLWRYTTFPYESMDPRPMYIPRSLPIFPGRHTYVWTNVSIKNHYNPIVEDDERTKREKLSTERIMMENNLKGLLLIRKEDESMNRGANDPLKRKSRRSPVLMQITKGQNEIRMADEEATKISPSFKRKRGRPAKIKSLNSTDESVISACSEGEILHPLSSIPASPTSPLVVPNITSDEITLNLHSEDGTNAITSGSPIPPTLITDTTETKFSSGSPSDISTSIPNSIKNSSGNSPPLKPVLSEIEKPIPPKVFPRIKLIVSRKPPDFDESYRRRPSRPSKIRKYCEDDGIFDSDSLFSTNFENKSNLNPKIQSSRDELINERVVKINEIAERHQENVKQLYYMDFYQTMLNYDNTKITPESNEGLQKYFRDYDLWANSNEQIIPTANEERRTTRRILSERKELVAKLGGSNPLLFSTPSTSDPPILSQRRRNHDEQSPFSSTSRSKIHKPTRFARPLSPSKPIFSHNIPKPKITTRPPSPIIASAPLLPAISKTILSSRNEDPSTFTTEKMNEFLSSFVWVDDDELTLELAEERAKNDAHTLVRIELYQNEGLLTGHTVESLIISPDTRGKKTHQSFLLDEMRLVAKRKSMELGSHVASCKKIAKAVLKWWDNEKLVGKRSGKEEERRIRKGAREIAKQIKLRWKVIDSIVIARYNAMLAEEQEKAGKRYLDAIVEHSEQVLNVQRNNFLTSLKLNNQTLDLEEDEDEENLSSLNSEEDEVDYGKFNTLEREKDMPLKELLEKYGYVVGQDAEFMKVTAENEDQFEGTDYTVSDPDDDDLNSNSDVSSNEIGISTEENLVDEYASEPNEKKKIEDDISENFKSLDYFYDDEDENLNILEDQNEWNSEEINREDEEFEADLDIEEAEEEEDSDEEMRDLENEADMPIEELLKKYQNFHTEEEQTVADEVNEVSSENAFGVDEATDVKIDSYEESFENLNISQQVVNNHQENVEKEEVTESYGLSFDSETNLEAKATEDENINILDDKSEIKNSTIHSNIEALCKRTPVPFLLKHSLREYQHVGLDWLVNLNANGLNGILADEMGLGKTIQTIALLAHLAVAQHNWGPHLVVVPTSVMLNWEFEFKKWCPGFKILTYYGNQRERREKRVGWSKPNSFHICITSYQLVLHDQIMFRRKFWQYLILDEAHNIKNFRSQRWQTLLTFNSERRLLLTGTPLQNNLMELWSLLYFLMPNGVTSSMPSGFATHKDFQEWFSNPVDKVVENGGIDDESRATIQKLHTVLRPYILRRMKCDVEKQMPGKYEHVVYCRLSKRQRYLYDDFMSRAKTKEDLSSGNYFSIINCLMQLRKVCNHPDLFEVRPIVTAFLMTDSVLQSFQPQTRAVLRLLYESKDIWNIIDLSFLNLIFTRWWANDSTAVSQSAAAIGINDCTPQFNAHYSDLIKQASILELRGIDPKSPNYSDLRLYAESIKLRNLQTQIANIAHKQYVNQMHCEKLLFKPPLIGDGGGQVRGSDASIVAKCRELAWRDVNAVVGSIQFERLGVVARALLDPVLLWKEANLEDAIEKFAVVSNKVAIKSKPKENEWEDNKIFDILTELSEHTVARKHRISSEMENKKIEVENLLHLAETKLRIAFPDRMLLQFDCGKLIVLDGLLKKLKVDGHRVLIFTQMAKVL
ncbi:swr1 complex component, partial [Nowakowskiella sp. JEL0078]